MNKEEIKELGDEIIKNLAEKFGVPEEEIKIALEDI
jgi:hypothetical protein